MASAASAALVYDLRLGGSTGAEPTSHTLPNAPGTYTLDLWARITGTNATNTDEKFTNSYVTILSTQTNGGAILSGGGGITGATLAPGADEGGSRAGGGADLNGDGVLDWGSTVTANANTNYMFARNGVVGGAAGGGTFGGPLGPTGWEFKLASFTVTITNPGTGETGFKIVQPAIKAAVGAATYATVAVDGTTLNVTSTAPGNTYTGSTGATVAPIPEPATIGLLGAAAVGLLGRRRSAKK
jgi:hypothetical protein